MQRNKKLAHEVIIFFLTWGAVGLVSPAAFAFEDIFENAVDYLSGPLGFVLGALGLGFSAALYLFGGEKYLGKVVSAAIGSLLLMSAPKVLSTIQGFVR